MMLLRKSCENVPKNLVFQAEPQKCLVFPQVDYLLKVLEGSIFDKSLR